MHYGGATRALPPAQTHFFQPATIALASAGVCVWRNPSFSVNESEKEGKNGKILFGARPGHD